MADPWDPLDGESDDVDLVEVDGEGQTDTSIFESASAWLEWLVLTVRRRPGPHMAWCELWWAHREAAARIEALWAAWELAEAEGGASPSQWWIYHFAPHWAALTDTRGPFAACIGNDGHVDDPTPLPVTRDRASVLRTDNQPMEAP